MSWIRQLPFSPGSEGEMIEFIGALKRAGFCFFGAFLSALLWLQFDWMVSAIFIPIFTVFIFASVLTIFFVAFFDWLIVKFQRMVSFVGFIILWSILFVLYVFVIFPVGIVVFKWSVIGRYINYRFSKDSGQLSSFVDPVGSMEINEDYKKHHIYNRFLLLRLISFIFSMKLYALIPVVSFLIVLAIIFAFVSSPIVAPFIYTIF